MPIARVVRESFLTDGPFEVTTVINRADNSLMSVPKPYGRLFQAGEQVHLPEGTELDSNLEWVSPAELPAAAARRR